MTDGMAWPIALALALLGWCAVAAFILGSAVVTELTYERIAPDLLIATSTSDPGLCLAGRSKAEIEEEAPYVVRALRKTREAIARQSPATRANLAGRFKVD